MRHVAALFCLLGTLFAGVAPASPGWRGIDGVIPNAGQAPAEVRFVGRGAGQVLLFSPERVLLVARSAERGRLVLDFPGQRGSATVEAEDRLPGEIHLIRGADPEGWRRHLPRFAAVRYGDLFPGVDLLFHLRDGGVKSDFLVLPGADPAVIRFRYRGARDLRIGAGGELLVDTGSGLLTEGAPRSYQVDRGGLLLPVPSHFVLVGDGAVGFDLGSYDPELPLVIDPGLEYAAYLGGEGGDSALAVVGDPSGNVYVAGTTSSVGFPTSAGAAHADLGTHTLGGKVFVALDAFVIKLSPKGKLVWGTYLGGTTDSFPHAICTTDKVDDFGNCVGAVASPWGTGGPDLARGLAVDAEGFVYVAGETLATDFPLVNPFQSFLAGKAKDPADTTPQQNTDAFVAKLAADGSTLLFSSYLGGARAEVARDLAVDKQGFIWVVGFTGSKDFPTASPLHGYRGGPRVGLTDFDRDAFVTRIAPDGATFVFSSPLGGFGYDVANAVAIDPATGHTLVAGTTSSADLFGISGSSVQQTLAGNLDGFVVELAPASGKSATSAVSVLGSTYLGGPGDDMILDLQPGGTGVEGNVFIAGTTDSAGLLAGPCAEATYDDCGKDGACDVTEAVGPSRTDAFAAHLVLSDGGFPCRFLRYLGGDSRDRGNGIAVEAGSGAVYVTGTTYSADFPVRAAFQPRKADGKSEGCDPKNPWICASNSDAFFTKLSADGSQILLSTYLGGTGEGYTTDDSGHAVAVAGKDNAVVVGRTYSADFKTFLPLLPKPAKTKNVPHGFVARLLTDVADVRIDKATVSPSPAARGAVLSYTVEITNDGPAADSVDFTGSFNKDVTYLSGDPYCTYEPAHRLLDCDASKVQLPARASLTVHFKVKAPQARTRLTLSSIALNAKPDPNDANNKKLITVEVGGFDLAIVANAAPAKVGYGEAITYTVRAKNTGPEDPGTVFADLRLPAGAVFSPAGSSPDCAPNGGGWVRCTLASSLPPGGSTPPAVVELNAPKKRIDLRVEATVSTTKDQDEVNLANNTKVLTTEVRPARMIITSFTVTPNPVGEKKPLTYQITAENEGPGDAVEPRLFLDFGDPAMVFQKKGTTAECLEAQSAGKKGTLCFFAPLSMGPTKLAQGAKSSFTIVATAPEDNADNTPKIVVSTAATWAKEEAKTLRDEKSVTVRVGAADLQVSALGVTDPASPPYGTGHEITLRATVSNLTANVTAKNVLLALADTTKAPAGRSYTRAQILSASLSPVGIGSCPTTPKLRCLIPALLEGQPATLTLRIRPKSKAETMISVLGITSSFDPVTTNDEGRATLDVRGHDLSVAVTEPAGGLVRGKVGTWSVLASNQGPGVALGANQLNVTFRPTEMSYVGSTGSCTDDGKGRVTCTLPELSAGQKAAIDVRLKPLRATPKTPVVFEVIGPNRGDDEENPADNEIYLLRPVRGADLQVGASGPPPSAALEVGSAVDFSVEVKNLGPADSKSAELVVRPPEDHLSLVSAPGCMVAAPGELRCPLTLAANGAPAGFALAFKATKSGTFTTSFTVRDGPKGDEDPNPANDTKSVETAVKGPDLKIAALVQTPGNPVPYDDTVTYAFRVENTSTKEASEAFTAVLALDGGQGRVKIQSGDMPGGTCTTTALSATCSHPGLPKSTGPGTAAAPITVKAVALGRGKFTVRATLAPPATDPNAANDTFQPAPATLIEGYALSMGITSPAGAVVRDQTATYVVEVVNNGAGTARVARLTIVYDTFLLKPKTATLNDGGSCAVDAGKVNCPLGDLARGKSKIVTVVFDAFSEGTQPLRFTVSADRPDQEELPASNALKESLIVKGADLDILSVTGPTPDVATGQAAKYVVVVQNLGPADAKPVTMMHIFPAKRLTWVSTHLAGPSGSGACAGATWRRCAVGPLKKGQSATVTWTYEASVPGKLDSIFEAVEPPDYVDEHPQSNQEFFNTEVLGPDLSVVEIARTNPIGLGKALTITYRVANLSQKASAPGVGAYFGWRTFTGPANGIVAGIQATPCAKVSELTVRCDLGEILAGQSVDVTTEWWAAKPGTFEMGVQALSERKDADDTNNVDKILEKVEGADLHFSAFTAPSGSPSRGKTFSYALTVENVGQGVPKTATLRVAYGKDVSVKSSAVSGGSGSCTAGSAAHSLDCSLGMLATSESRQVSLDFLASRKGTESLVFTLVPDPGPDAKPADNTRTETLQIRGADLRVIQGPGAPASLIFGDDLVYSLQVDANPAFGDALTPQLLHTYPPGSLKLKGFTSNRKGCQADAAAGKTVCSLDPMTSGAGATPASVTLTYAAAKVGPLASTFTAAEAFGSDEAPADNSVTGSTQVQGADLGVSLSDGPDPVGTGATLTYTATLTNHGPAEATKARIVFSLPPEVRFGSASSGCSASGATVTCTLPGALAKNAQASVQVKVTPRRPAAAAGCSVVAISEPGDDGPQPNSASTTTRIDGTDSDGDGVPDYEEAQGPNGGDGDGNGVPDSQEPEVGTLKTGKGDYLTVRTSAGSLKGLRAEAAPQPTPAGVAFPVDALSYRVEGLQPGGSATVSVYMPAGIPAWAFWKYGPEPGKPAAHWYDFSLSGGTGATAVGRTRLDLTLVDGKRGDDDLSANGVIVDPGAPALALLSVHDTGDGPDVAPGDGACADAAGACTLRAAIMEANASPALHLIAFDLGTASLLHRITPDTPLPDLSSPAVIDGRTQPTYDGQPVVEIDAWPMNVAGVTLPVLRLTGGDSALFGLAVFGSGSHGAEVSGGARARIADSVIGISVRSAFSLGNDDAGIHIAGASEVVIIRSTILANGTGTGTGPGVWIEGATASKNRVVQSIIGAEPDGSTAAGNQGCGVRIDDASGTEVRANTVLGNWGDGICIFGPGAQGNRVAGNRIGLDAAGGCSYYETDPATNEAGAGHCANGNTGWGVRVGTEAHHNMVGGATWEDRNLISANRLGGVLLESGATANTVSGNWIGTDRDGLAERHATSQVYPLENLGPAIQIDNASGNLIGGSTAAAENILAARGLRISGKAATGNIVNHARVGLDLRGDVPVAIENHGVEIVDGSGNTVRNSVMPSVDLHGSASANVIESSFIGTDTTGTQAFWGVDLGGHLVIWSKGVWLREQANLNIIRGNVIAGSYLHGVDIWQDASFNQILDNRIGVDATGKVALRNYKAGVHLDGRYGAVTDTLIEGNTIAGNGLPGHYQGVFPGIWLREGPARITLRNNRVGVALDGVTPLGHLAEGIWANGAPQVTIEGNTVGANARSGIVIDDGPLANIASIDAVVRGNAVGTDALGLLDLGNGGHGVWIQTGGVAVGGTGGGQPNTIAHNGGTGLLIQYGGTGVATRANRIFDNGGLGIDLGFLGVDPNDPGDTDGGTNLGQNYPTLSSASLSGTDLTVVGTLHSGGSATYTLDLFLSAAPDPTGYGEAERWLGETTVTTDVAGDSPFSVTLPAGGATGRFVSATATDAKGNTSELSVYTYVDAPPGSADVGVRILESRDPVGLGVLPGWSVDVTNLGPNSATAVVLSFTFPPGFTYFSDSPGAGSCTHTATSVTCALGTLAPGTVRVWVDGLSDTPGVVEARAAVSTSAPDPNAANDTAAEAVTVAPADLSIAMKAAGPGAVGEPLELSATVQNGFNGVPATAPVVTFVMPAGGVYAGANPDTGSCAESAGTVTCTLGALDISGSTTVRISFRPPAAGTLSVGMEVSSAQPDPDPSNNASTVKVKVEDAIHDLRVSQQINPSPPALDASFDYVVTVRNEGPSPAVQVLLTDTLPIEVALYGTSPSQGVCVVGTDPQGKPDGTVRCNLDEIARGAQATVTLTVRTGSGALLFNEACAEAIGLNLMPGAVCDTTVIQVGPADTEALLAASPDPVKAGKLLTLSATVKNHGPSLAKGARFTILLPLWLDLVSTTLPGGCTTELNTTLGVDQAVCPVGDIASGAEVVAEVVVRPTSAGYQGIIMSASSDAPDPATYNDKATTYVTVEAGPAPLCPKGQVLKTLLADSTETGGGGWGPSADDTCTTGCAALAWSLVGDATHSGSSAWFIPDHDSVSMRHLEMGASVQLPADATRVELVFWHRYDTEFMGDGGIVEYSTDDGQTWQDAKDLILSIYYDRLTMAFLGAWSYNGQNPSWPAFDKTTLTLDSLKGSPVRFRLLMGTNDTVGGVGWWVDDVEITACAPEVVATDADLSVGLTGTATAKVAEGLIYTLSVQNLGPLDATGVVAHVAVPAEISLLGIGCTAEPTGLACTVGALANGATVDLSLLGEALAAGKPSILATVSGDQPDPAAANDAATAALDITADLLADLDLSLGSAPAEVTVGAPATVVLNMANAGPDPAAGTLSLALPPELSLDQATPSQGSCAVQGDGLTCDLGSLAPGAPPATLTLSLRGEAAGTATFTASLLTSGAIELNGANQTVVVDVPVFAAPPEADLSVQLTMPSGPVLAGASFTLTTTVHNAGPSFAEAVVLTLNPGGAATFGAPSGTGVTCEAATKTCTLPVLFPGKSVEVSMVATATIPGAEVLGNASVASSTLDPKPSNDQAQASVATVAAVPSVGVRWSGAPVDALNAKPFQVTAEVDNHGALPAAGVELSFAIPEGVEILSIPGACARSPAEVVCPVGDLGVGASAAETLALSAPHAGSFDLVASLHADTPDADAGDDSAQATVQVGEAAADLRLLGTLDTATPAVGSVIQMGLDLLQDGPDDAYEVSLKASLPAGFTELTMSISQGSCVVDGRDLFCDLGTMPAGTKAHLSLGFTPTEAGDQAVFARGGAGSGDPDGSNNQALIAFAAALTCGPGTCDDANPCTADTCTPQGGCAHEPQPGPCDDGDPCTQADLCLAGACFGGEPTSCQDGDPCTLDLCDPAVGCTHEVAALPCDDGDACTTFDLCEAGVCTGLLPLLCDGSNTCTVEACDPASGCVQNPVDCDDADPCTSDGCDPESGCTHAALSCDDADACTTDACDPQSGCTHLPLATPECACAPAQAKTQCAEGDLAWLDGCGEVGGSALSCDDGDPSTQDLCDEAAAVCLHLPEGATDCDVACEGDWKARCESGHLAWVAPCGEVAGIAQACSGANPCIETGCDPDLDACTERPANLAACAPDPGCDAVQTLSCEGLDLVWRDGCGQILGNALSCDDGDPDTEDLCDETLLACLHTPASAGLPNRLCASGSDAGGTGSDAGGVDTQPGDPGPTDPGLTDPGTPDPGTPDATADALPDLIAPGDIPDAAPGEDLGPEDTRPGDPGPADPGPAPDTGPILPDSAPSPDPGTHDDLTAAPDPPPPLRTGGDTSSFGCALGTRSGAPAPPLLLFLAALAFLRTRRRRIWAPRASLRPPSLCVKNRK